MKKSKIIQKRINDLSKTIEVLTDKTNELYKNYENLLNLVGKGSPSSQKLLVVAMDEYIKFLKNEDVQAHEIRERGIGYVKDINHALTILREVISKKYRNLMNFRVSDIDNELVGWFFIELESKNYKNKTFNDVRTNINSFEIWLLKKEYLSKRYFNKIQRKPLTFNPQSITKDEFERLLKIIKPETGKHRNNLTRRMKYTVNYRPWLIKGYKMLLELGVRMNELLSLKYSNVIEENGNPVYIRIEDIKINEQRKIKDENYKKYKALPISKGMLNILNDSGYKSKKGSDEYILVPEITDEVARKHHIGIVLSNNFRYYYRKLNTGRQISIKSLRVTDATGKFFLSNGHPEYLTGHSSPTIVKNHYIDKTAVAKELTKKGYSIFNN